MKIKKYEKMELKKQGFVNEEQISSGLTDWLQADGKEYADAGITTYAIVS